MITSLRQNFNQRWTPEHYRAFLGLLEARVGEPARFRHSETPCFLPAALIEKCSRYGREMLDQLLAHPTYMASATAAIPEQYRTPNCSPRPLFVQADFGLDQNLEPRLVEIQGFPSLYAYQRWLSETYAQAYDLGEGLGSLPAGLGAQRYVDIFREAVVADADPERTVLLEVDPQAQKTWCDFVATERMLGIRTIDIRSVVKQCRKLFYHRDGRLTPIDRIYNRTIVDELERRRISIPFSWIDDLDVQWAGHPQWFFLLSKFSLPFLQHEGSPPARFLHQAGDYNAADCVLKPLYSFAGLGVVVGPGEDQIANIPQDQRSQYLLQDRVDFRPVIETPAGPTRIEIREMYICHQSEMLPVNVIIRMGRGAQMGVDFNRNYEWVGASAAFLVPDKGAPA